MREDVLPADRSDQIAPITANLPVLEPPGGSDMAEMAGAADTMMNRRSGEVKRSGSTFQQPQQLGGALEDVIGGDAGQKLAAAGSREDAYREQARGSPGFDVDRRVPDVERVVRLQVELAQAVQDDIGVGLAPVHVLPADDRLEQRPDPPAIQIGKGAARGRGDAELVPPGMELVQEIDAAGERLDLLARPRAWSWCRRSTQPGSGSICSPARSQAGKRSRTMRESAAAESGKSGGRSWRSRSGAPLPISSQTRSREIGGAFAASTMSQAIR